MNISLIIAPYDSGHHKKRLGLGPTSLQPSAQLHLEKLGHVVTREEITINNRFPTEVTTSFEVSRKIAEAVRIAKTQKEFPIIFSGNCNTAAIGAISGLNEDVGVIWFDCHGDFNTPETTIGGFLDGMAISMIAGQCYQQLTSSVKGYKPVPENKITLIGARDFDPLERERLKTSRINIITPDAVREQGDQLIQTLTPLNSIYLHIDLDVLDPSHVKVNTYSTSGGLSPEELYHTITLIKNKYKISAVAFTAYDPGMDIEKKIPMVINAILDIIIGKR
jgi:arginase